MSNESGFNNSLLNNVANLNDFCEIIPENKEKSINFGPVDENPDNLKNLLQILEKKNKKEKLNFFDNKLNHSLQTVLCLCDFLKRNSKGILSLDLENNNLGLLKGAIENLVDALIENKSIQELILKKNCIGEFEEDIIHISKLIEKKKHMKILSLSSNKIGLKKDDFSSIICALNNNCGRLKSLDLQYNYFEETYYTENLEILFRYMKQNKNLKKLEIFNVTIDFDLGKSKASVKSLFSRDILPINLDSFKDSIEDEESLKIKKKFKEIIETFKDLFKLLRVLKFEKCLFYSGHFLIGEKIISLLNAYA